MEPSDKDKLYLKRQHLQQKLRVQEDVRSFIDNWLEVYDYILSENLAHQLCNLAHIGEQDLPYWLDVLNTDYSKYNFTIDLLKEQPWLDFFKKVDALYPNSQVLKYIPPIEKISDSLILPQDGLNKCIEKLKLTNQKVLLYYQRYTPILEISLYDLHAHADAFFYLGCDEAVIIPRDLEWMIFYSINEEWYAGSSPNKL